MIYIDVSPVAFSIGAVTIGWYGIMVALAVLTLICWTLWQVKKDDSVSSDRVINAAIVGVPSGVIGARLLHILDHLQYYIQHPHLLIGGDGLAIYGAVLGAALGIWIYSRVARFPYGHFVDILAPGIILAQAVGRVGCTLNGCCYGDETSIFCAIVYTNPTSLGPIGVPVHPTQIYEIIYNLIVFGVLVLLRRKFRPDGSLFVIYLSLYALWRFAVDFIREGTPFIFGLHEAQVVSVVILLITVPYLLVKTRWVHHKEAI